MSGLLGGIVRAAKFLTGGKYHWRAIPTALVGMNLLSPKQRMDPAYQQMAMYGRMGGFGATGQGQIGQSVPTGNPNTGVPI